MNTLTVGQLLDVLLNVAGFLPPEDLHTLACTSEQHKTSVSDVLATGLITYKHRVEKLIGVEISYTDVVDDAQNNRKMRTWHVGSDSSLIECSWTSDFAPHDWKTTYNLLLTEPESLRYSLMFVNHRIADAYGLPSKDKNSNGYYERVTDRLNRAINRGMSTSFKVLKEYLIQTERYNDQVSECHIIFNALQNNEMAILREMTQDIQNLSAQDALSIIEAIDSSEFTFTSPQTLDLFLSPLEPKFRQGMEMGHLSEVVDRIAERFAEEDLCHLVQVLVKHGLISGEILRPSCLNELHMTDGISFYLTLQAAANKNQEKIFLQILSESKSEFSLSSKEKRKLTATARYYKNERIQRAILLL